MGFLDKLLDGGWRAGEVHGCVGAHGAGKTLLSCVLAAAAVRQAADDSVVVYVDSYNGRRDVLRGVAVCATGLALGNWTGLRGLAGGDSDSDGVVRLGVSDCVRLTEDRYGVAGVVSKLDASFAVLSRPSVAASANVTYEVVRSRLVDFLEKLGKRCSLVVVDAADAAADWREHFPHCAKVPYEIGPSLRKHLAERLRCPVWFTRGPAGFRDLHGSSDAARAGWARALSLDSLTVLTPPVSDGSLVAKTCDARKGLAWRERRLVMRAAFGEIVEEPAAPAA